MLAPASPRPKPFMLRVHGEWQQQHRDVKHIPLMRQAIGAPPQCTDASYLIVCVRVCVRVCV